MLGLRSVRHVGGDPLVVLVIALSTTVFKQSVRLSMVSFPVGKLHAHKN